MRAQSDEVLAPDFGLESKAKRKRAEKLGRKSHILLNLGFGGEGGSLPDVFTNDTQHAPEQVHHGFGLEVAVVSIRFFIAERSVTQ